MVSFTPSMRRFLLRSFLFFAGLLLLVSASTLWIPHPSLRDSLYYALLDKHELLDRTPSPWIIFLGGSNLSFGLDSARIVEETGTPAVNMGIHAGFGLKFILRDVEPHLRPRDVVVLVPEYSNFYSDQVDGNIELLYILFDVLPEARGSVPASQWCHLLPLFPRYSAEKIFHLPGALLMGEKAEGAAIGDYDRKSFNAHGDAFAHWGKANRFVKITNLGGTYRPDAANAINDFTSTAHASGADVLLLYPCFQESNYDFNRKEIESLHRHLAEALSCRILGDPARYRMEDRFFYNARYHLNREGVAERTRRVIEDLTPVLPSQAAECENSEGAGMERGVR